MFKELNKIDYRSYQILLFVARKIEVHEISITPLNKCFNKV